MISYFEKARPYKNLLKNFTSLSILQISNYVFPLIILPYVVRVLGPDKYGLIQFAAAFNLYFQMLCDYNFSLSGTRIISQNRSDQQKVSEIFSSIIYIKIFFSFISFTVLALIVFLIDRFNKDAIVYLLSFGMVFGSVLSPLWYFQGIERMKYITRIQISIRILSTISVFIFIRETSDYLNLVIINSSTQLAIGVTGLFISVFIFRIKITFPGFNNMTKILKYGWNMFLSSVAINIYTTSNTFILGLFTNDTIVGYYAAADKIRIAFQGLQSTLSLSVFPFVSKLAKDSYSNFINFNRKLLRLSGAGGLFVSIMLFIFAEILSDLILGKGFVHSADLLKIISVLPFIISLSNVLGIQTMLPLGFDKSFNKIIGISAGIHLIILFILIPEIFAFGVAYTVVVTEIIVTLCMVLFLLKKRINIFTR